MKHLIHLRKSFQSKKIQSYLDKYPYEHQHEFYGKFWLLQEVLAQNNNLISINYVGQITYEYVGYVTELSIGEDDIEEMIESGVVGIDDSGNIYSPFQKFVNESKHKTSKAKFDLNILEQKIASSEKLLARLQDKIEFTKNRKKKVVFK